jgi:hypothetical protein
VPGEAGVFATAVEGPDKTIRARSHLIAGRRRAASRCASRASYFGNSSAN